ncbi:MAG: TorF family putative porin [Sulfurovaceae bacterium]|jgi:uncharacterized protein (TIGR02001 family)
MKVKKLSLIAIIAMSSTLYAGGDIAPVEPAITTPTPAAEESSDFTYSANMALTSNYVWRGITQTDNSPAIQGGIDLGYKGFYAGVWGSNVEFGSVLDESMELDFYGGYKGEIAGIGYDLGYIEYAYPHNSSALNFGEAYVGLSKSIGDLGLSGKYYFGADAPSGVKKLDYYELGASYALPYDISIGATYGDYEDTGSNYSVKLSKPIGKFTASLAYTDFNADSAGAYPDQDHVVATISTSF